MKLTVGGGTLGQRSPQSEDTWKTRWVRPSRTFPKAKDNDTNQMNTHSPGRHVSRDEFFYVVQDNYDEHAEIAIPGYIVLHDDLLDFVSRQWGVESPLRILDLGTGTGKTIAMLLKQFPKSQAVAIDLFDEMLRHAAERLREFGGRVNLRKGDFIDAFLGSDYDLCVSALAIHHQEPEAKRELFARIFDALKPSGCFCMIDWIKFDDPKKMAAALATAEAHVRNAVPNAIADEWVRHWRELNRPDATDDMCQWLQDSGFSFSFCAVRHYAIALIYAQKST